MGLAREQRGLACDVQFLSAIVFLLDRDRHGSASADWMAAVYNFSSNDAMSTTGVRRSSCAISSSRCNCACPLTFWSADSGIPWTTTDRSEEHTSELQSLMRISYAVFCLKKKKYKYT